MREPQHPSPRTPRSLSPKHGAAFDIELFELVLDELLEAIREELSREAADDDR